jgi:hypothetical protein
MQKMSGIIKEITSFSISNDTGTEMIIMHEPDCFEFDLPPGEELIIETYCCRNSIVLNTGIENGKIRISITGNKSLYNAYHKGENIFKGYFD